MGHAETFISFLVAILGIAYPIIIQVVSRIEDKYCSHNVAVLFEKEPIHKWFLRMLICSIIVTILWTLDLPPLKFKMIELMFEYGSDWVVLVFVTILIVVFFLEVKLLMTYSVILRLSMRIKTKYNRSNDLSIVYFVAAGDLLISALRTRNLDAIEYLDEFIGGEFEEYRSQGN
ncbi:MAG: hypothetical protein PHH43_05845 [Candidatus Cloacimonetes bacterium]|nr:hypothetical protein [Candidatus Cloacimonadota bacterium]